MRGQTARILQRRSAELPHASLFIEDDSLHFEYGHCLPRSKNCSVVHGHSSRISAELFGEVGKDGMIVDFGEAKDVMKSVLKKFDHKFIVGKRYAAVRGNRCHISFDGPNGHIEVDIPLAQAILLEGEATSENIAAEIAKEMLEKMPEQVKAVKAFFFEGANKGASLFRMRNS
ncbi:MAG: 6-carboxytetrahydropterin synthase [Conexivisphaerales archaeon]